MDLDVDLPEAQVLVGGDVVAEQRAFQGRVVAEDHREGVQRQDVARLDRLVGDGVVGAVGVDAGLEPGPCVHQLHKGEVGGDLADHCGGRGQGDLLLGNAGSDSLDTCLTTKVTDPGTVADQVVLLCGLDRPHPHGCSADINQFDTRQGGLELPEALDAEVVELDSEPRDATCEAAYRLVVVVPSPIGVDHVVPVGPTPRLPAVDSSRDGRCIVGVDNHSVATSEVAVEPPREVADVVKRGKEAGIQFLGLHVGPQVALAAVHLGCRERRPLLFAPVPAGHVDHVVCGHVALPDPANPSGR